MTATGQKYSILKECFGYGDFRGGQEELIDAQLSGQDAFGIMPTGGGKSLCYQIPAMMMGGVTLVVSPLISLMKDQVMALKNIGVAAAYINSSLTSEQIHLVYRNMALGKYKIIYIAPERLLTDGFCRRCPGWRSPCWRWMRPIVSPSGDRIFVPVICGLPIF